MTFWNGLTSIGDFLFNVLSNLFNIYTTIDIFIAVFIIWLVRRILKAFNIIS